METNTHSARIAGLDLMKMLGLYLVVLYHLTFRSAPDTLVLSAKSCCIYALSAGMSICVPLFFTASGALSLTRPMELRRNTRRCIHLLLLVVFWNLFSLAAVLVLRGERLGLGTFFTYALNCQYDYIQHLWYLSTFLFLSLFLPAMHALRTHARRVYRFSLAVLVLLVFGNLLINDLEYLFRWLLGQTGYSGVRQFFGVVNQFGGYYWYAFAYLALGAFLMEHREALRRRRKAAAAAILPCILALTLFGVARSQVRGSTFDPIFNNYSNIFTLVLTAAVTILLDRQPGPRLCRISASIGGCSLGIYLVHWLLIEALRRFAPGVIQATALAPLTAVAVLGISWGISWCCMKLPLVRNLFTASPDWVKSV